ASPRPPLWPRAPTSIPPYRTQVARNARYTATPTSPVARNRCTYWLCSHTAMLLPDTSTHPASEKPNPNNGLACHVRYTIRSHARSRQYPVGSCCTPCRNPKRRRARFEKNDPLPTRSLTTKPTVARTAPTITPRRIARRPPALALRNRTTTPPPVAASHTERC